MKRRAGMTAEGEDPDEEDDGLRDDDGDDDEGVGSSAENLRVFCCSSTEYQKMRNLLTDDGPPQVRNSVMVISTHEESWQYVPTRLMPCFYAIICCIFLLQFFEKSISND